MAITLEIYGKNRDKEFSKTRIGCRGIIIRNGEILISHETKTDYYVIPVGGLEGDESLEICCAREILEETGYLVKVKKLYLTLNEYYKEYKFVSNYFICEVIDYIEPELTELEAQNGLEAEWLPVTDVLKLYENYDMYTSVDMDKRNTYLREFTGLSEYLAIEKREERLFEFEKMKNKYYL